MPPKLHNKWKMKHEKHPFHMVDPSPWPMLTAICIWSTALGFIAYFHYYNKGVYFLLFSILSISFCLTGWFYDMMQESTFQGFHTFKVQQNIYLGMLLFIVSEMMFFFSFFWALFHFSLSPSIWIGELWPPKGIHPMSPWAYPIFNYVLLLMSSMYATEGYSAMSLGQSDKTSYMMTAAIMLGGGFLMVQFYEYNLACFSMNDSVYGSIFYMLTGLHGLHVLVGTIFFCICLVRHQLQHFSKSHHVGFVCAIWYWHFVDIVWVFLYFFVYVWGK